MDSESSSIIAFHLMRFWNCVNWFCNDRWNAKCVFSRSILGMPSIAKTENASITVTVTRDVRCGLNSFASGKIHVLCRHLKTKWMWTYLWIYQLIHKSVVYLFDRKRIDGRTADENGFLSFTSRCKATFCRNKSVCLAVFVASLAVENFETITQTKRIEKHLKSQPHKQHWTTTRSYRRIDSHKFFGHPFWLSWFIPFLCKRFKF